MPSSELVCVGSANARDGLPELITQVGLKAERRYVAFFATQLRNPATRAAYHHAAGRFFAWCLAIGLRLETVEPTHVAAYIELQLRDQAKPTVKKHLAAIRHVFDWFVAGGVCPVNPAASVRGPRHSATSGKTPVLGEADAKRLLMAIEPVRLVDHRDRALLATMLYTFGRVSAVVGMDVADYYPNGKRWWLRLHEKGGKDHQMPAHHKLEEFLDAYLAAADLAGRPRSPLFPASSRGGRELAHGRLSRSAAWRVVRRRAAAAGVLTPIGPHSLRATGITNYMQNGGQLAEAQRMAAHADPRTTRLYDRSADEVTLDEVERITI